MKDTKTNDNILQISIVDALKQSHLNSIIGPRAKQCTVAHTYTITHRNKIVNVDKIKHTCIFIVLVLPTKSVLKH